MKFYLSGSALLSSLQRHHVQLLTICLTFFAFSSLSASAASWSVGDCHIENISVEANLNTDELRAICEASSFYNIDVLWRPGHTVVLIGEIHDKGQTAFRVGMNLVNKFSFRGLEFYPAERKWWHYPLIGMSYFGEAVIDAFKWVTFNSESIDQGSLMDASYVVDYFLYFNGSTEVTYFKGVEVERQTLQEFRKSSISDNQVINFHLERNKAIIDTVTSKCGQLVTLTKSCNQNILVGLRNEAMVEAIDQGFSIFPERSKMVVMVGASHVPGMSRLLTCNKGYQAAVVTRGISIQKPNLVPMDEAARTGQFCP